MRLRIPIISDITRANKFCGEIGGCNLNAQKNQRLTVSCTATYHITLGGRRLLTRLRSRVGDIVSLVPGAAELDEVAGLGLRHGQDGMTNHWLASQGVLSLKPPGQ